MQPWISLGKNIFLDLQVEPTNQGSRHIQGYFDQEDPQGVTQKPDSTRRSPPGAPPSVEGSNFHPATLENPVLIGPFFPGASPRTSP